MHLRNSLLARIAVIHITCWALCCVAQGAEVLARDYNITPVNFSRVHVDDGFWSPRLDTNSRVTIPYAFEKCEETDRISNFEKTAGLRQGGHEGFVFNDSDVYKVMEGAAYSLQVML